MIHIQPSQTGCYYARIMQCFRLVIHEHLLGGIKRVWKRLGWSNLSHRFPMVRGRFPLFFKVILWWVIFKSRRNNNTNKTRIIRLCAHIPPGVGDRYILKSNILLLKLYNTLLEGSLSTIWYCITEAYWMDVWLILIVNEIFICYNQLDIDEI